MTFKSGNWQRVQNDEITNKVCYTSDVINYRIACAGLIVDTQVSVRAVVVSLMDEKTGAVAIGVARCSPKDDFDQKLGREIAAGRALKLWEKRKRPTKSIVQKNYKAPDGVKFKLLASSQEDVELYFTVTNPQS